MPSGACSLTVIGGSSSIKFASYVAGDLLRRILDGSLQRIGLPEATFVVKGSHFTSRGPWRYRTHPSAAGLLMDWLSQPIERGAVTGVGHCGTAAGGLVFTVSVLPGASFVLIAWLAVLGFVLSLGLPRVFIAPQSRGSCIFERDAVTAGLNG